MLVVNLIIIALFIVLLIIFFQLKREYNNVVDKLTKVINTNKKSIQDNQQLIHYINVWLSNSNIKVDWEAYKMALKQHGVDMNSYSYLDITDPEG